MDLHLIVIIVINNNEKYLVPWPWTVDRAQHLRELHKIIRCFAETRSWSLKAIMNEIDRLVAHRAVYVAKGKFAMSTVVLCPACLMGVDTTFGVCLDEISRCDIAHDVLKGSGKPYQVIFCAMSTPWSCTLAEASYIVRLCASLGLARLYVLHPTTLVRGCITLASIFTTATSDCNGLLKFCSTRANLSLCLRDEGRTLPDFRSVSRSLPELVRNYTSTDCNGSSNIERSASISRPVGTSNDEQKARPTLPVDGLFGKDLIKNPLVAVSSEDSESVRVLPAFLWAAGLSSVVIGFHVTPRCLHVSLSLLLMLRSLNFAAFGTCLLPFVSSAFFVNTGNFIVENGHLDGIFRISGEKAKINLLLSKVSGMIGEAATDEPLSPDRVLELESLFLGDGSPSSGANSDGKDRHLQPQQYVALI